MPDDEPTAEKPKPDAVQPAAAPGIKRLHIGIHVAAQILLAALLLVMVNYLSSRHHVRKDLTDDRRYTLGENTAHYLKGLDQEVKITMAFAKDARIYPQLSALLDEYEELSGGKVKVEKFDPGRDKARAIEFRNETSMLIESNMLILDFGGRRKTITEAQMLADEGRMFFGEDVITSRIIGTTEEGDQKVYFLGSYGGLRMVDGRTPLDELAILAGLQFAQVERLNLADVHEIPHDADAIVLLNPEKDLEERDLNMLTAFWEESGSMLIFLNPQKDTPRLDRFLANLGVARRDDRVLHVTTDLDARPEFRVQGRFLSGSKITAGIVDGVTTFNGVTCSLDVAIADPRLLQDGVATLPLMQASDIYWGESRYDTGELPVFDPTEDQGKPVYLAAAVERAGDPDGQGSAADRSRLVVVANGTLLDPDTLGATNADFTLRSLNWVLDREVLIGLSPPKRATTYSIEMTEGQTRRTFWLAVIIFPGSFSGRRFSCGSSGARDRMGLK